VGEITASSENETRGLPHGHQREGRENVPNECAPRPTQRRDDEPTRTTQRNATQRNATQRNATQRHATPRDDELNVGLSLSLGGDYSVLMPSRALAGAPLPHSGHRTPAPFTLSLHGLATRQGRARDGAHPLVRSTVVANGCCSAPGVLPPPPPPRPSCHLPVISVACPLGLGFRVVGSQVSQFRETHLFPILKI
jgi:hypothetical protein